MNGGHKFLTQFDPKAEKLDLNSSLCWYVISYKPYGVFIAVLLVNYVALFPLPRISLLKHDEVWIEFSCQISRTGIDTDSITRQYLYLSGTDFGNRKL